MNLKQILKSVAATAIVVVLISNWSCNCPPPTACANPNPLVARKAIGFSVTPDSLAGVTSVKIVSFDSQGNFLDSVNIAPKTEKNYQYGPSATRPIQLHFYYKSSNGQVIAEDQLRVDDSETNTGGVVALDVVMGFAAPNPTPALSTPPQCPTTSATSNGAVGTITFSCATNDWFQVKLVHNNVEQRIGLYVWSDSIGIYRSNIYTCLTNPTCTIDEEDGKSADVAVSSPSNLCTIGATLNQANGQKAITIAGPSTCLISVNKK